MKVNLGPNIEKVEKKFEKIENLEAKIYGNVITIMTIFIGIFSLINLNINYLNGENFNIINLTSFNLIIIGSLGLFAAIISALINKSKDYKIFIISVTVIIIALIIFVLL